MSKPTFWQIWRDFRFWERPAIKTQLSIGAIFCVLIIVFLWSIDRYWQNTLQPRFYKVAETQAQILADSQASLLTNTFNQTQPEQLGFTLDNLVQEMLLAEDPAIGGTFIEQITLSIDYTTVAVTPGSLDMSEGQQDCAQCFRVETLLTNRNGEILGLAEFVISDVYYLLLSQDMKSKLFAEATIISLLLLSTWIVLSFMFYRLQAAKQLIEASDQAKTRFMANVTHELRTPLNAILGYTQLYKKNDQLMADHRQGIETIDQSADHLLLMINDILEFSRANEEILTLHPEKTALQPFFSTLIEMTRVRAELKGLDFNYEFSSELLEAIYIDEKRLRQILLNLLSNAVKFTDKGNVTFSVSRLPSRSKHTAKLCFSIKDTGVGIDPKQLKNIFIAFHQIDNAITRAEGSGLGLTISQRLVSLMGSKLRVDSKAEQGSEFWFVLETPIASQSLMTAMLEEQTPENEMAIPHAEWLEQLTVQVRRHNVLGIRNAISELEENNQYELFLAAIQPYIRHYRFKQLLDWLEQLPNGQQKD